MKLDSYETLTVMLQFIAFWVEVLTNEATDSVRILLRRYPTRSNEQDPRSELRSARRSLRVAATTVVAVFASGVLAVAGIAAAPSAGAATTDLTPAFYLALGASVSVGVQPTIEVPHGEPTDRGYANDLVAIEMAKGVALQLTKLGCPGESAATFIYGGDKCYTGTDTQLTAAVSFLQSHQNQDGIVTIDLGFNTMAPCVTTMVVDSTCVANKSALLRSQLGQIITTLRAAAGPNVTFVGVGHYDPYLTRSFANQRGKVFASHSIGFIGSLNIALRDTYSSFAVPMADVAAAFAVTDHKHVSLVGHGHVPTNVANDCRLTWLCAPRPFGPNIHPNDAGYQVIAEAIADALPTTLYVGPPRN